MSKYECPCGYVYDPAEKVTLTTILSLEQPLKIFLTHGYAPLCGAEKEYFEKVE